MKRIAVNIFVMMCVALSTARPLLAGEAWATELMRQRSLVSAGDPARIQAVLAKARRGEPICVAAIGGSITAGGAHTKDPMRRYVQQLAKWFEKMFPGLKVRVVNVGIGATNSGYGALRVQRDGHNLPVAKGLAAGLHRVAVVVKPFSGGKERADKVQIWWGGGAGL